MYAVADDNSYMATGYASQMVTDRNNERHQSSDINLSNPVHKTPFIYSYLQNKIVSKLHNH